MKLFKTKPVFDRNTGESAGTELTETDQLICDYTGEVIDTGDHEIKPQYQLSPEYDHGCEEVYYYDDVKRDFEELGIDYASLFTTPFVFAVNTVDHTDESLHLVQEWLKNINTKSSIFYHCSTIEEAMRIARTRTVLILLKAKKYTAEELGLGLEG